MKITVLVENTGKEPLKCEHGLSLLIEFQGNKYLLDAGTSDIFMENAKRVMHCLKVNLISTRS